VTTDDCRIFTWQHAKIPKLHLLVTLAIPAGFLLGRRRVLDLNQQLNWHFFALARHSVCWKVQTVSRATLLFGMTWIVNAIVISAVLVMILLSNFGGLALAAGSARRDGNWSGNYCRPAGVGPARLVQQR